MNNNRDTTLDQPSSLATFFHAWNRAWNQFWFQPEAPYTLGAMRIMVGLIVLYTHFIWGLQFSTFLGVDGLLPLEYRELLFESPYAWSHFDWFSNNQLLLVIHILGLITVAMFTFGIWTNWTSVLTALLIISYANRGTGAIFGLDQISSFLCIYLAIGNCGGAYSIDQWIAKRRGAGQGGSCTRNQIAIRLIQIHMCVVYLFAAIGKLQGTTWLNGEAVWGSLASYEYQSIDMSWISNHMWLVAILTLGTLIWELAYPALIWLKLTRPIMLLFAVPIHLGIGFCMGMLPFGLVMLAGNLAFVDSRWIRNLFNLLANHRFTQKTRAESTLTNAAEKSYSN